jgi:hypothetical protein
MGGYGVDVELQRLTGNRNSGRTVLGESSEVRETYGIGNTPRLDAGATMVF